MAKSPETTPKRKKKSSETPPAALDTSATQDAVLPPDTTEVVPPVDAVVVAGEEAGPQSENAPTEPEFVRVTPDDVPGQKYAFYIVDESADPGKSFIEEGSGKRLREATAEENNSRVSRQQQGKGGNTRQYQKKAPSEKRRRHETSGGGGAASEDITRQRTEQAEAVIAKKHELAEMADRLLRENKISLEHRTTLELAIGSSSTLSELNGIETDMAKYESSEPIPTGIEQKHTPAGGPKDSIGKKQEDKRKAINDAISSGGGGEEPPVGGDASADAEPEELHPKQRTSNRREYVGLEMKSVKEILSDPMHQLYFGELIHALEPKAGTDILKRLLAGSPTDVDMDFFNYASKEYSKRDRMWSDLTAHMSEQDVEDFKRRNKSLDNIIAFVGKGDALNTFKNMLRHKAMYDEDGFTHIEHAVHHMHEVRGTYLGRRSDEQITEISADLGIPKDQFVDIFDFTGKDKKEMEEAKAVAHKKVMARVQMQAGGGRKMMDWIHGKTGLAFAGSSATAADSIVSRAEYAMRGNYGRTGKRLDALNAHLDRASSEITKVLDTAGVRDKIVKEALTGIPHRVGAEAGPTSYAEVQTQGAAIKEPEIQQLVQERIKQEGPKWESGSKAYQDSVLRDMKQKAIEKTAGGGFYAWLLAIIFGTKFNKAASKATGRPVHVK